MLQKECQISHLAEHKRTCRWGTELSKFAEAYDSAVTLDGATSRQLVEAATPHVEYVGEEGGTGLLTEVAFFRILEAANSPDNERLLGKAGACALLANELDRSLSGKSEIALDLIMWGIVNMTKSCVKNVRELSERSVLANITRALRVAMRDQGWAIMEDACGFLFSLLREDKICHCEMFHELTTFEVIGQCAVVAACYSEATDAAEAGFRACGILGKLHDLAKRCSDLECPNRARLGDMPGLTTALEVCWHRAVNSDEALDVMMVVSAMRAAADPEVFPDQNRRALATARVCGDLVRALERFSPTGPEQGLTGRVEKPEPELCVVLCRFFVILLRSLTEGKRYGLLEHLQGACAPVVSLLRAANQGCQETGNGGRYPQIQHEASIGLSVLLIRPENTPPLVLAGACEVVIEMLCQGVNRNDASLQSIATATVPRLASHPVGAKRLATSKRACRVLVKALTCSLANKDQPPRKIRYMALLVASWGQMTVAYPPCRRVFLEAGADAALGRAKEMAVVAEDCESADWFRFIKEESLVSSKGKARKLF
eukprot:jgi/Mesvir1/15088/Mv14729-RA.2